MIARLLGLPVEAKGRTPPITPLAEALRKEEPPEPDEVKAILDRIVRRQRILEERIHLQRRVNGATHP
jgi:hypothetical protein